MTDWFLAHWLLVWLGFGLVATAWFASGGPLLSHDFVHASPARRVWLAAKDFLAVALFLVGGPVALAFLILHALDTRA